jgi:hypothetical protein
LRKYTEKKVSDIPAGDVKIAKFIYVNSVAMKKRRVKLGENELWGD